MPYAQRQRSLQAREPYPERFHVERFHVENVNLRSLENSSWSHDPNALRQQGSWVGSTMQYAYQNEDPGAVRQSNQQSNASYHQQHTPVQRPWEAPNTNTNSGYGYGQQTATPGPASSTTHSPRQGYSRTPQRNSNVSVSSQHRHHHHHHHPPSTSQTSSSSRWSGDSAPRPSILNSYDQTLQPLDMVQNMLQQSSRAGPYDAVGYIRQDERAYEEYEEYNGASEDVDGEDYAAWEDTN
ncbi:hypothetical protein J1614_009048 [Plenodomus biglobosus]|nr:hypothetical protein J1614_009048 [Plenodomus biglobosus]